MSEPLFSFGTSRGGTTFFARVMSVNAQVKMASDPFLPLFREFRNQIMKSRVDPSFDTSLPLDDYYFSSEKSRILELIQDTGLDLLLPESELAPLLESLVARMSLAARELIPLAGRMTGRSFTALLRQGLDLMTEAYQAQDSRWVGSNDNWVVEFLPHLAAAFPTAKFIVIVRDPRASMASLLKLREKEPALVPLMYTFARHWRKHAAFAWKWKHTAGLQDRVFLVRYEDFVRRPEAGTKDICGFLGVAYDPRMLDPNFFRPIEGKQWKAYSHFQVKTGGIYTDSIEIWKSYLPPRTVEFIEFVCGPEMQLMGYDRDVYRGGASPEALAFMREDDKVAKGWRGTYADLEEEYVNERMRHNILALPGELVDPAILKNHFLFPEILKGVKVNVQI